MAKAKQSNKVPAAPKEPQPVNEKAVAKPAETVAKMEPPKQKATVKPQNFQLAEFKINQYVDLCEVGTTPEDILRPEYWCHVAAKLTVLSQITVINRLAGWEASLRVVDIGKGFARVVPLGLTKWQTASRDTDEIARLKAMFNIETRPDGLRVLNASGDVVAAGLQSMDEAETMVDNAVKAMTAKAA